MKLYEKMPDSIEYGGKTYRLDLSFRKVLASFDAMKYPELEESAQIMGALDMLVVGRHPNDPELLKRIADLLTDGKQNAGPAVIDFNQDSDAIYSSFLQAYGIDLFDVQFLHWKKFSALLSGLPQDTKLAYIVDIRARDIPQASKSNAKYRAWLAREKAKYSIHTEGGLQRSLNAMFETMKAAAGG